MTLKPELVRRLLRFALVGGTVMVFFMGLNWLFGRWVGATAAFLLAYPPALALHYSLNKWWTFGCERTDHARQISEYLVMVAVTFVVQYAFFWLANGWLGLAGWLSAGIANAAQMVLTFVIMQRRVFAGAVAAQAGPREDS
jgi:putative flippase GtrA